MRKDREWNQLRSIEVIPNYLKYAEGSALVKWGDNIVLVAASVEDKVPPFLKGTGKGWITAEYAMLPRSTDRRKLREGIESKVSGRSHEIQRLIGRALRAVTDLDMLGERTVTIDCDVIQADGGTRMASILGGVISVYLAFKKMVFENMLFDNPLRELVGGVSLGIVDDEILVDLDYEEDSKALLDLNIVITEKGEIVEIQGTGEGGSFSRDTLIKLVDIGIEKALEVIKKEKEVLEL
ncbi:MAG: ribonuclease PH [Candidatus Aminicenantes bacterium]|nr:ribonuclease PH [Candidatus Aminicenantes bacterium]